MNFEGLRPTTKEEREKLLISFGPELGAGMVEYLLDNGFCTAPASTKWHGNYEGGLFDHSYEVSLALRNLTLSLCLAWENPVSPIRVAFFHDLCKLDKYKKVDDTRVMDGKSEVIGYHYEYSEDELYKEHGMKSVLIAQQHTQMNPEEFACIRYHMGAYETSDWDFFDRAIRKYPNVLYTHTADMIASKIMGV
jgi:hypothetical protein